ncbi:MAG: LysR family transcriptional regulator [Parasphingorhabdus sp.]
MRLRQIEIFYHVYRAGSISGAARELHVSQPSVSKVLRYAEDQLGFDLFSRQKGRLYPTPAAHELYDEIKDIYRRISSFNRIASNIRNRKGGHVRIGVLPSLSLSVAPDAISRLRKTHPDLSFELTTLHSDELAPALIEKKCDICIGFEDVRDERIDVQNLAEGQFVLVADQDLESQYKTIDLSVLNGANIIGIKASGPLAELLSDTLQQEDVKPNEVVTVHTYYLALALVQKGVGLAVIDEFSAFSPLGSGLYKHRLTEVPKFPICSLSLVDHQQMDLIQSCLTELKSILR